jgi:anti-anti-sigma factor
MLSVHVAGSSAERIEVVVVGDLIDRTAELLRRQLIDILEQKPRHLLVDLGRVGAMTSVGERLLLEIARSARASRVELVVHAGTPTLRRRFVENGFDRLVPVLPPSDAGLSTAEAAD